MHIAASRNNTAFKYPGSLTPHQVGGIIVLDKWIPSFDPQPLSDWLGATGWREVVFSEPYYGLSVRDWDTADRRGEPPGALARRQRVFAERKTLSLSRCGPCRCGPGWTHFRSSAGASRNDYAGPGSIVWIGQGDAEGLGGELSSTAEQSVELIGAPFPVPARLARVEPSNLRSKAMARRMFNGQHSTGQLRMPGAKSYRANHFGSGRSMPRPFLLEPNGDARRLMALIRSISVRAESTPGPRSMRRLPAWFALAPASMLRRAGSKRDYAGPGTIVWLGQGDAEGLGGELSSTVEQSVELIFEVIPGPSAPGTRRTIELEIKSHGSTACSTGNVRRRRVAAACDACAGCEPFPGPRSRCLGRPRPAQWRYAAADGADPRHFSSRRECAIELGLRHAPAVMSGLRRSLRGRQSTGAARVCGVRVRHGQCRPHRRRTAPALYIKDFSGEEYRDYVAERALFEKHFRLRLKTLLRFVPDSGAKRLLEIGSAYGFFLAVAREHFKSVEGIDISADAVAYAVTELGLTANAGDFLDYPLAQPVDVVCMWDTIEHLQHPHLYIERASANMNRGGMIAITTGDIASLMARMRGARWDRSIRPPTCTTSRGDAHPAAGSVRVHRPLRGIGRRVPQPRHDAYIILNIKRQRPKLYKALKRTGLLRSISTSTSTTSCF